MKPRIDFECCDSAWVKAVGDDVLAAIRKAFDDDPKYKERFDSAPLKLPPSIVNCWLYLPEEEEAAFRVAMATLPERYTTEEFWSHLADYESCIARRGERRNYLLNFIMQPWELTEDYAYIYTGCDLLKL